MNADLQNAKQCLLSGGYTCVLCREEVCFSSTDRGVKPLLTLLDSGKDFAGFSAADKVVGRATAFLYCLLGVREVYAQVLSDPAAQVLDRFGIRWSCENRVAGIRNRENTGPCPMEYATRDISDPAEAVNAIRVALQKLQKDKDRKP